MGSSEMVSEVDETSETGSQPDDVAIACPPAGKWISFIETADENGGKRLRFEMWLAPQKESHGPARHIHPEQNEMLEVREGYLGVWHDGETDYFTPGESVTIPAGDSHRFWNAGDDRLRMVGEVRPALRTEEFMRVIYGLARDGHTTSNGIPKNPLRLAPIIQRYDDMLYLSQIPITLQKGGMRILAPVARRFGYAAEYPEYLDDG